MPGMILQIVGSRATGALAVAIGGLRFWIEVSNRQIGLLMVVAPEKKERRALAADFGGFRAWTAVAAAVDCWRILQIVGSVWRSFERAVNGYIRPRRNAYTAAATMVATPSGPIRST